jgi:hypothetical protein
MIVWSIDWHRKRKAFIFSYLMRIRQLQLVMTGRIRRREEEQLSNLHLQRFALIVVQLRHHLLPPVVQIDDARHEQRHRVHPSVRVCKHPG